jgi:hypothetical protein
MTWILYDTDGNIKASSDAERTIDELFESGFTGTKVNVGDDSIDNKRYVNGTLVDIVKSTEEVEEGRRDERLQVFSRTLDVMNPVWYNSLTTEQQTKLATWRQAWLDYPETGVKPDNLSFM